MDFIKYFPTGFTMRMLPKASILLNYGTDGTVYVSADGFVSSKESVIRKLNSHFTRYNTTKCCDVCEGTGACAGDNGYSDVCDVCNGIWRVADPLFTVTRISPSSLVLHNV